MSAILQPVILRLLAYVLSSLVLMIPASWAGVIVFNETAGTLSMSLTALAGLVATAIAASGGIVLKWGIPVPQDAIKGVVLRVILYAMTPALALIPSSFAGVVNFDQAHQMLTVSLSALVGIAVASVGASGAIFAKWGIKSSSNP